MQLKTIDQNYGRLGMDIKLDLLQQENAIYEQILKQASYLQYRTQLSSTPVLLMPHINITKHAVILEN